MPGPAVALIAAPHVGRIAVRKEFMAKGKKAYEAGAARQVHFDPRSLIAGWWYEGWDAAATSSRAASAAPAGLPGDDGSDAA